MNARPPERQLAAGHGWYSATTAPAGSRTTAKRRPPIGRRAVQHLAAQLVARFALASTSATVTYTSHCGGILAFDPRRGKRRRRRRRPASSSRNRRSRPSTAAPASTRRPPRRSLRTASALGTVRSNQPIAPSFGSLIARPPGDIRRGVAKRKTRRLCFATRARRRCTTPAVRGSTCVGDEHLIPPADGADEGDVPPVRRHDDSPAAAATYSEMSTATSLRSTASVADTLPSQTWRRTCRRDSK